MKGQQVQPATIPEAGYVPALGLCNFLQISFGPRNTCLDWEMMIYMPGLQANKVLVPKKEAGGLQKLPSDRHVRLRVEALPVCHEERPGPAYS